LARWYDGRAAGEGSIVPKAAVVVACRDVAVGAARLLLQRLRCAAVRTLVSAVLVCTPKW